MELCICLHVWNFKLSLSISRFVQRVVYKFAQSFTFTDRLGQHSWVIHSLPNYILHWFREQADWYTSSGRCHESKPLPSYKKSPVKPASEIRLFASN